MTSSAGGADEKQWTRTPLVSHWNVTVVSNASKNYTSRSRTNVSSVGISFLKARREGGSDYLHLARNPAP
jgi:hypothetical protein